MNMEHIAEELHRCLRRLRNEKDILKKSLFLSHVKKFGYTDISADVLHDGMLLVAKLLLKPSYTLEIAVNFPYLLVELLSLATVELEEGLSNHQREWKHQQEFVALAKLSRIHPDALKFSFHYFETRSPKFEAPSHGTNSGVPWLSMMTPQDVVQSFHLFLQLAPSHFRRLWNWPEIVSHYLPQGSMLTWLSLQCAGIVMHMNAAERSQLASQHLSATEQQDCMFTYEAVSKELEVAADHMFTSHIPPGLEAMVGPCKGLRHVVPVAGVLLPVLPGQSAGELFLHVVPTTRRNLHRLAVAVVSGKAVCLVGPVGSGKTDLVEQLARLTGRDSARFVKLQISEDIDSKLLVGTYTSTSTLGEFKWEPGILTTALMKGQWLLVEDIDLASPDVAAVLSSVLEQGSLLVPGCEQPVKAATGFHLFFTRRSSSQRYASATNLLQEHWLQVIIHPLTKKELLNVVKAKFPLLDKWASRIVRMYMLFSYGNNHVGDGEREEQVVLTKFHRSHNSRHTSTRDLMKYCQRIDTCDEQTLFRHALDIFSSNIADKNTRVKLAAEIGFVLGLAENISYQFCVERVPHFEMRQGNLQIGAVSLEVSRKAINSNCGRRFSWTLPAAAVMESVACCVLNVEPVLLVGETATGKTLMVQHLADLTGNKVVVVNMSQQNDPADLLGGYKPVNMFWSLHNEFEVLLESCLDRKIKSIVTAARKFFNAHNWSTWLCLLIKISKSNLQRYRNSKGVEKDQTGHLLEARWFTLLSKLDQLDKLMKCKRIPSLKFVEGTLVKAVEEGHWILLDEINLATPETLHCLSSLLESRTSSLQLLERADKSSVERHPHFRLFACMNPSTDVGKRELPQGLRNRFTEIYVDEMTSPLALISLVQCYLQPLDIAPSLFQKLVKFYLSLRSSASSLADGTGRKPHYSLRTLCRALSIAAENKCESAKQSLFEGMCIAFLTQLKRSCYVTVEDNIRRVVFGNKNNKPKYVLPPKPNNVSAVLVEGYWISEGTLAASLSESKYVLTDTVKANLKELARAVSLADCPILLQGPTSVGKTSLITYLAGCSGNHCVRINNHEHTDLQEYVGMHAADNKGQLVFQYGVLVEAMKNGYWLILDELNLAPTDVLEALNRLLDDNRELYITETQEVIKAHKNFRIFATQNPPGVYGGRKVLSRAFRNRFVELHFDSIPSNELQEILHKCCSVPPNCCKNLVAVMNKLQLLRRGSATFAGRQGFMTLRDLFRWARRYHVISELSMPTFYDWDQHMAEEGFLLLAGRVRKAEERIQIQDTIDKVFKRKINPDSLFDLNATTSLVTRHILHKLTSVSLGDDLVWTRSMRQMAVLVCKAHQYDEPVLLVGGTGCGKTTLCQKMSKINCQKLYTINCHMNSESSDFLGGLRPTREKDKQLSLFEWVDGPLVLAMKEGGMFLADEISLAEDSVLERLNPLLEPDRTLLLSEKGSDDHGASIVKAHPTFQFVGTMNPGGDFGKKELSPALRNRFTEIWCEPFSDLKDLEDIINFYLCPEVQQVGAVAKNILEFIEWYKSEPLVAKIVVSIRDILTWVSFINKMVESQSLTPHLAFVHGGMMTLVNGMCVGDTGSLRVTESEDFEIKALHKFKQILNLESDIELVSRNLTHVIHSSDRTFGIGDFKIEKGTTTDTSVEQQFVFKTSQTCEAALHVLRSMQLHRPVLLEGSPGVGKTALVQALANCSGFKLVRINLSEQTDVSDLFGADLPVEDGEPGHFAWHDGPFLQALKAGDWILLDELNLSSQSILEGLNACLDHRGEVYIPELGKTFSIRKDSTRIFATQNPTAEGGGRKGLPKSFLNRFLKVYIKRLRHDTYKDILYKLFPHNLYLDQFLKFVRLVLEDETLNATSVNPGSSFNLRDACRWCKLVSQDHTTLGPISVCRGVPDTRKAAELVYFSRMRTDESRKRIVELYNDAFNESSCATDFPMLVVEKEDILIGDHVISLNAARQDGNHVCKSVDARLAHQHCKLLLRSQVPVLNALLQCITMAWHPLLIGGPASGKTSVVQLLTELVGVELRVLPMNSAMDTMEILGGFEQWNIHHHLSDLISEVDRVVSFIVRETMLTQRDGLSEKVWDVANEWWRNTQTSLEDGPAAVVRQCESMKSVLHDLVAHWKVWNPKCCHDLGIDDLLRRLERVQEESTRDLSAGGGKFEWVDSLLVKCLKDGAWLLVENVNLCSSAVLDRLNALLEPGGVLSVDERGVGPDNKVVTVRPHPNFRIVFTMNPEYGEVSRAMRNRCVEIFMKPMSHTLSKLDSHSLLANLGLHSSEILLNLQETVPFDTFGHLIWIANIACQQAIRGLDVDRALKDTILDMHGVMPGRISRQELEEKLNTVVTSSETLPKTIVECIDLKVATLKTAVLNDQRTISLVKQDCLLLSAFLRAVQHSSPQLTDLFQLLPSELVVDYSWLNGCDIPEMAVLLVIATFFTTANNSMNLKWVSGLLKETAKDQCALKTLITLVGKVYHGKSGKLVWDFMMPDSLNWLLLELSMSSANHRHLAGEKSSNTIRIVDAPSYCGTLQHHHPLVLRCGDIIDVFDKCLEKLLQSKKFLVSDFMRGPDKVNILLEALLARNDFSAAVFTVMYENIDGSWMIVLSSLKKLQIYYNWFYDTAYLTLEAFLKYSNVSDISTATLQELLPTPEPERMNDHFAGLEKHPSAWFSRGWPAVLESLRSVSSSFRIWDEITDRKIHVIMDQEYEVAFRKAIALISQSISDKNPSEEVVQSVGRVVEVAGRPIKKEAPSGFAVARVSLWPVQELLCVKLCALLRKEMLRHDCSMSLLGESGGLVSRVGSVLCALPTTPLELKVFIQALANNRQVEDSFIRVAYEVATLLLQHAKSTPAANKATSLCLWLSNVETSANKGKMLPPLHCPVLAVQLKQLLQNFEKFLMPTLDSSKARILQLNALHETLWRNMVFFTSPKANFYHVERQCALLAAENITMAAREAVEAPNGCSLENCIKLLQLPQDDVNFMLSAAGWVESAVQRLGKDKDDWAAVGLAWVGLGLLQAKIQEFRSVSDWHKREALASATRKVTYLSKRLFAMECWSQVKMCSIQSSSSLKTHPAIYAVMKSLTGAELSKQELEETIPERPNDEELHNMTQVRSSYLSSITSPNTVSRLLSKLCDGPKNCNITAELELLLGLNERHITQLRKYCDWFPDYIHPVMLAAAQISYGLSLLRSSAISCTESVTEPGKDYLMGLIRYPVYKYNDLTMMDVVQRYLNTSELSVLLEHSEKFSHGMLHQTLLRLQVLVLQDIHSDVTLNCELEPAAWECVNKILKYVVELWRKHKIEAERKKQEEESLYTSRTKIHCETVSDEDLFKQDMERLFHISEHQDFRDLAEDEAPTPQPIDGTVADDTDVTVISDEYLYEIHDLHSKIVSFVICDWLALPKSKSSISKFDHLSSWLGRCQIFNSFIEGVAPLLGENFDQEVYTSYLLMTSAVVKLTEGGGTFVEHTSEDFYSASNITEVVSVISILKTLLQEVNRLLTEWPENPILVQILTVAERILSFPVDSPVSRFLTGLETLLPRVEEWEVNAHQGVSLGPSILELNKQILSWKKLELSSWKGLLSASEKRAQVRGSQWWPHLYELLHISSDPLSKDKFLEVVWQFMHESTLGEFQTRLHMLYTFHCDAVLSRLDEHFKNVLWNVYKYYAQFLEIVKKMLVDQRTPIEKKLKDLIKISSWNYSNVAALKKKFEKSKRAIVKHIREYETVLKQRIFPGVTLPQPSLEQHTKALERLQALLTINTDDYISDISCQTFKENDKNSARSKKECSRKLRDLCKDVISTNKYEPRICAVHDWSAETFAAYVHLTNLQVDRSAPVEKQKSWAKSTLQQKRRFVSNLFKELQMFGFSHRWGAGIESSMMDLMFLPPVDVAAVLCQLDHRPMDDQVVNMWKESESLFHKNIARMTMLRQALNNPSKDMEMHLIGRMKGSTSHLMSVAEQERVKLVTNLHSLCTLRYFTWQLACVKDTTTNIKPWKCQSEAKKTLVRTCTYLSQLSQVFDTYPQSPCSDNASKVMDGSDIFLQPLFLFGGGGGASSFQEESALCKEVKVFLEDKEHLLRDKLYLLQTCVTYKPQPFEVNNFEAGEFQCALSPKSQEDINSIYETLLTVGKEMKELCHDRCQIFSGTQLTKHIMLLSDTLIECADKYNSAINEPPSAVPDVQRPKECFKTVCESNIVELLDKVRKSESDEQDVENILKVLEKLDDVTKALNMNTVVRDLYHHLLQFSHGAASTTEKRHLDSLVPLLEQFACVCQLFLVLRLAMCQAVDGLLATVLVIFEELARKGYQIPEELMPDEEGKGDGGTGKGGMGLGDGEGEKDVSDRIESEDQLEEARPAGEKPPEDTNPQCPEENENGIDMSEDFDGEVGEAKEASDEEGPEKSDGEKEDDEMGSASDNEQDKPYWGSDQSSDEAEDGNDDGKGQEQNNKEKTQLGAKDQESTQDRGQEDRNDDINDMDDGEEAENQVDPYHGNMEPVPEPEPLEIPEDLQLDDGDAGEEQNAEDEANPFDVDDMKEVEDKDKTQQQEEGGSQSDEENDGIGDNAEEAMESSDNEHEQLPEEEPAKESEAHREEDGDAGEAPNADEELAEKSNQQSNAGEEAMDADSGVQDQATVNPDQQQEDDGRRETDSTNEEAGVGQAERENDNSGHQGDKSHNQATKSDSQSTEPQQARSRQRPRESEHRTLGSSYEPVSKRLKTIEAEERETSEKTDVLDDEEAKKDKAAHQDQLYQHIDSADNEQDVQTLDTATKEQAQEKDWQNMELDDDDDDDDDDETPEQEECPELQGEEMEENQYPNSKKTEKRTTSEVPQDEQKEKFDEKTRITGEIVQTMSAERGQDVISQNPVTPFVLGNEFPLDEQVSRLREQLLEQLASWTETLTSDESRQAWGGLCFLTNSLAQELSEQLRMILEPTRACRLKGDYKSGRRINMRKVIPYIASGFRKDKIWLRRTKLSKREYQILLAIDDSQSMQDNRSKELAFESLSLVSQALVLLEAGHLGVVSFGEEPILLHPLSEPFTDASGSGLVQRLEFKQARTRVGKLVEFATCVFSTQPSSHERAQLLIIISDGRGVDSEGPDVVRSAVQQAQENNIFIVYIIMDNPQESILDVCSAVFDGSRPRLTPYMESFPFPFYLVLKDINMLPLVLSDALRQWFELVASIEQ